MKRNYSEKAIQLFSTFPQIKHVNNKRISFTFEYRTKLYEAWLQGINLKSFMKHDGLPVEYLHNETFKSIINNFKQNGRPKGAKNKEGYSYTNIHRVNTEEEIKYLLETGVFLKNKRGLSFTDEFIKEAFEEKDKYSIEELLMKKNINIRIVGYSRIYALRQKINGKNSKPAVFDQKTINKLKHSPYIDRCTPKQLNLKEAFYDEAYSVKHLNIVEIFELFEIRHDLLDASRIQRIDYKLRNHQSSSLKLNNIDEGLRNRINKRKSIILEDQVSKQFDALKKAYPSLSFKSKKEICLWIKRYPLGSNESIRSLLQRVGISKSSYYAILKDKGYIKREKTRLNQEQKDLKQIQKVIDYKGYPKGSRMIKMMMEPITGKTMGRQKILRLMKKYDIKTKIRQDKHKSIGFEGRKKSNILNRQFKMARPMMHLLTDVSYLKIGNQNFYLSAILDGVTSKVISLQVSEYQDTHLVSKSLDDVPIAKEGALMHSDQGILYMSDVYQAALKELGYKQSMSRRGNCWDNAPVESFFGHFKDEVDYTNCDTFEHLKQTVKEYKDYYNDERPQWDRLKMTPLEYEKYLEGLDEASFDAYYQQEADKYEAMMKTAAKKAKKRAKELGALI